MTLLVGPLFEGPIDIVSDVHGESGALVNLLDRMGYDANGMHKENRRLVFVGDLVDRGPDSVTVVTLVKRLCEKGVAQMVLGNHELNLLKEARKHGNLWWYGETEVIRMDKQAVSFQVFPPSDKWREEVCAWLVTLPLALENSDTRVCHACWHHESIESLRSFKGNVLEAFAHFSSLVDKKEEALKACGAGEVELELLVQNGNPVNCVCSGMEELAPKEYFAGGKMRKLERARWWERYTDAQLVVFGHYWRRFPRPATTPESFATLKPSGEDPFAGHGACEMLGENKTAVCIDFSVGVRYEERGHGLAPGGLGTALVALRLPEMALHLDDGQILTIRGNDAGREGGGKRQKT